jgi:hydrogenase nickel incorporation protein HypB
MCENCGCGDKGSGYTIINPVHHDHDHTHSDSDSHSHSHEHQHQHQNHYHRISIETDVLQQNNLLAQRNRGYFEAKSIMALNLVSSPGSGKTTLLERTIRELPDAKVYVIEGDQQTSLDANRIQATGAPVLQVNTGNGCHLDAGMIYNALKSLSPQENALLMIENVGNLVCPALFDLGERYRVVIISVTEGEDKPLKYPNMFQSAQLCVINKIDLLPYLDFNVEKLKEYARQVNPQLHFLEVSAKTGAGFPDWLKWIMEGTRDNFTLTI